MSRFTDKTILSYEAARTELDEYVDQSASGAFKLSPLIRAVDHLETTIDSLHRVACFTERLRRDAEAPPIAKDSLPSSADRDRVRQMRHAIQHADEQVLGGWGNPLLVCEDRIELSESRIRYQELAAWIEAYHDITKALVAYQPPGCD